MDTLKIYAVNTPTWVYISDSPGSPYETGLKKFLFDGTPPEQTFHKAWVKVSKRPGKVTFMERQPNINYRYHLIDETLESDKLPLELVYEQVYDVVSCEWRAKYRHMESLYALLSDHQPDVEKERDVEWIDILTASTDITAPPDISYTVQKTRWSHEGTTFVTNRDVTHQLIDAIIFPSIVIHERPCKFTSHETYKIIRQHVKDNIDPKVAVITSDYEFCFTVKKRVPLAKPYQYQVDVNNSFFSSRKRKPKMVTRTDTEKHVAVFEMTYSPENYKGYTPIQEFEAENEAALKEQIDAYLAELMAKINEPMRECEHCNGVGYVQYEVLP